MTHQTIHSAAVPTDVRAEPSGEVHGLAVPYNILDAMGTKFQRGAFAASIAERTPAGIGFLWAHDGGRPVGRWQEFRETPVGLEARGFLALSTDEGQQAFGTVRNFVCGRA